jgi:hypothetical protein
MRFLRFVVFVFVCFVILWAMVACEKPKPKPEPARRQEDYYSKSIVTEPAVKECPPEVYIRFCNDGHFIVENRTEMIPFSRCDQYGGANLSQHFQTIRHGKHWKILITPAEPQRVELLPGEPTQ